MLERGGIGSLHAAQRRFRWIEPENAYKTGGIRRVFDLWVYSETKASGLSGPVIQDSQGARRRVQGHAACDPWMRIGCCGDVGHTGEAYL